MPNIPTASTRSLFFQIIPWCPTQLDTSMVGAIKYDGLLIKDSVKKFKTRLFAQTITYRPGSLYSSSSQNTTLNRFINLGAFKFVKNRFEAVEGFSSPVTAECLLLSYTCKKKSLQGEIYAFTKENNSIGAQLSVNWKNRNLFGGAELLTVKAYTGFEVSTGRFASQ